MQSKLFGEFMGTMILILLGNGVVAGVLLNKSKAQNAGWIVITAGWAFAVMAGVFTSIACGSSDAPGSRTATRLDKAFAAAANIPWLINRARDTIVPRPNPGYSMALLVWPITCVMPL